MTLAFALTGCAPHLAAQPVGAHPGFASEDRVAMACNDLRNHIVAVYADEDLSTLPSPLSPFERAAYRASWAEDVAKSGSLAQFDSACRANLTMSDFQCSMAAKTPEAIGACMRPLKEH